MMTKLFIEIIEGSTQKIWKTTLCLFRKKGDFFRKGGAIAPFTSLQLSHWFISCKVTFE